MNSSIEIKPDSRYTSQELITWWSQDAVATSRVIVVGAGAIGNEVIKNLALLGVGHLRMIDMDSIELGNLSRSVLFRASDQGRPKSDVARDAALQLNPSLDIQSDQLDVVYGLGLGDVAEASLVLGCVDNRLARRSLNEMCRTVGKPWIDAAIDEMNGQVRLFGPGQGACYECLLKESDLESIRARYSCPLLARDRILEGKVPTTVTSAALVAAWQCQEAMKHICGQKVAWGSALISSGLVMDAYMTTLPRKEGCPYHDDSGVDVTHTVARTETWESILNRTGLEVISLRHGLITGFECLNCSETREFVGILGKVRESDAECPRCGGMAQPSFESDISRNSTLLLSMTPGECQIPRNEILQGFRQTDMFSVLIT